MLTLEELLDTINSCGLGPRANVSVEIDHKMYDVDHTRVDMHSRLLSGGQGPVVSFTLVADNESN